MIDEGRRDQAALRVDRAARLRRVIAARRAAILPSRIAMSRPARPSGSVALRTIRSNHAPILQSPGPRSARACRRPHGGRLDAEHRGEPLGRQRFVRRSPSATILPRSITSTRSAKRAASVRSCMMARIAPPPRAALAQQLHHDELMARIERGGRLVGEQHGRLRRERAGERDARLLAAGERRDGALREGFGFGRRKRVRDRGAVLRRRGRERIGMRRAAEHHDRRHAHRPVEDMALRQIGDVARALARLQRFERLAAERDRALRRQRGRRARASAWSCRRRSDRPARPVRRRATTGSRRRTIVAPPSRTVTSLAASASLTTALLRAGAARGRSSRETPARRSAP